MEKIEVVKSYWKAEGDKNLPVIMSHFAEDANFDSPTMKLEGKVNIEVFYKGMVDSFRSIKVFPTHWIEQGEEIAVEYDCELVRNSGEKRFAKGFNLFKIRNGIIQGLHCYFNPADF